MKVENSLCFYVASSEENLIKGVAAAEKMLKILLRVENLKNRKHKNVNKIGMKRKCMNNSSGKCQRKLIGIELGNGYPKVT